MSEVAMRVELDAIATAASSFERASVLALLVETGQELTLTELVEKIPKFVVEHGGQKKIAETSTGQTSWNLARLAYEGLVEMDDNKRYRATEKGRVLYENFLEDAYVYSLNPSVDPKLKRLVESGKKASKTP